MVPTDTVLELFREVVEELDGRVSDAFNDGQRLFARSILPAAMRVSGDDVVEPGVALRYMNDTVEVRPYVHRVVCRNGAILAFSGHGRSIHFATPDQDRDAIRQAIHAAAAPETFHEFVVTMRESRRHRPDPALFLIAFRRRAGFDDAAMLDVLERFRKDGGFTLFAMANAVTALARDTRDPVKRWDREAAGAEIFARVLRPVPVKSSHASQARRLEPV
ncbi:MAG: DUF932 domain-containing protein [Planctomycetota bacterium]|jgi:hypothetical protein